MNALSPWSRILNVDDLSDGCRFGERKRSSCHQRRGLAAAPKAEAYRRQPHSQRSTAQRRVHGMRQCCYGCTDRVNQPTVKVSNLRALNVCQKKVHSSALVVVLLLAVVAVLVLVVLVVVVVVRVKSNQPHCHLSRSIESSMPACIPHMRVPWPMGTRTSSPHLYPSPEQWTPKTEVAPPR